MTKITSIEERVEKLLENETDEAMHFFPTAPVVAKQTVVLILTQALTAQRTALLAAKDREIVEAYAQGWNEGQIDLSARLKP